MSLTQSSIPEATHRSQDTASSDLRPDYRPEVDGLRAIAILGVVAYHADVPGISGGFVGVDVFFVISGYLITQLLLQEWRTRGTISLAAFYARRARRLLPAWTVVVIATLLAGSFLVPPGADRQGLAMSALASAAFAANHYFLATTGGYFDGPSELKPLLHLWSLAVEEQFYLVWPALFLMLGRASFTRTPLAWRRGVTVVIAAASLGSSLLLVAKYPAAVFFTTPTRAWELAVGAWLALGVPRRVGRSPTSLTAAWIGLASIVAAYTLITPDTSFPGIAAVLPVGGAALLIWSTHRSHAHGPAKLLRAPIMVSIGKLSYGWYLWHWPVLALSRSWRLMEENRLADAAGAIVALLLAAITLRYVEIPIRGHKHTLPSRVFASGVAALSVVAGTALLLYTAGGFLPHNERDSSALRAAEDRPAQAHIDCLLSREKWNGRLPLQACTFGDKTRPVDVVIWGDSHAMSWVPVLEPLLAERPLTYMQLTMSGCRPLAPEVIDRPNANCQEFRRQVLHWIAHGQAGHVPAVIMAGRWPPLSFAEVPISNQPQSHPGLRQLISSWLDTNAASLARPRDELSVAISTTFSVLSRVGSRVLVLIDPPEMRYSVPSCLYVNFRDPGACGISRSYYERNFASVRSVIGDAAQRYADIRVVDSFGDFCTSSGCPALAPDDTPILYDADHVAASAALAVGTKIIADLRWVLDE